MTSQLQMARLQGGGAPVFTAHWNGKSVKVRLDISACLKLEGTRDFHDFEAALADQQDRIGAAARRLLEMRQTEPDTPETVVVITALDLD
jgi:hypothetical protein